MKVTRPLYSPPCWRVKQLQRCAWEHVGREKLLLRCRLLGRASRFGAYGGSCGGISWRLPAYSLFYIVVVMGRRNMSPYMLLTDSFLPPDCDRWHSSSRIAVNASSFFISAFLLHPARVLQHLLSSPGNQAESARSPSSYSRGTLHSVLQLWPFSTFTYRRVFSR